MTRRVVVTGMGMLTALGQGVAPTWAGLVAGTSGVRTISSGARVIPCVRSRAMRRARPASRVSAIPPSAVVMIFTGWKLNTAMSL